MRIHLNLTPTQVGLSEDEVEARNGAPKPLLAMSPQGELVLVELQGSLEMDASTLEGDSQQQTMVGELHWGEDSQAKPTLVLSHHRLEGKLTKLSKPLAVLEKRKRIAQELGAGEEAKAPAAIDCDQTDIPSSPVYAPTSAPGVMALMDQSSDEEGEDADDDDETELVSPSTLRKRRGEHAEPLSPSASRVARNSEASLSSSLSRPTKKRAVTGNESEQTQCSLPPNGRPASSSPPPPPPVLGSALDYSSPPPNTSHKHTTDEDDNDTTPKAKRPAAGAGAEAPPLGVRKEVTSTYYDVVCIIRQKLLFSKRPEPVVHLQRNQSHSGKPS